MEMPVMMPMKAWRRLARKYRVAMKNSKRMGERLSAISSQHGQPSRIITTKRNLTAEGAEFAELELVWIDLLTIHYLSLGRTDGTVARYWR